MLETPPNQQKPCSDWQSHVAGYVTSLHRETVMALLSTALLGTILYLGVTRAVPELKQGMKDVALELKDALKQVTTAYEKDQDRDAKAQESKDRVIESMIRGVSPRSIGFVPDRDFEPPE